MADRSLLEDVIVLILTAQEELGIEMDPKTFAKFIGFIHNSHLNSPLPSLETVKILLTMTWDEAQRGTMAPSLEAI